MNIAISIIMPIFNEGAHLATTITSILSQENVDELEVLCIDDGSSDNSVTLLQALASEHPQIKLLQQQNQGPAAARNRGIELARGRYILFVDGDDKLAPNSLSDIYQRAVSTAADVLYFGFERRQPDGQLINQCRPPLTGQHHNGRNCFTQFYDHLFGPAAWLAIYNSDFLKRSGIRFPTDSHYEDAHFFRDITLSAKNLVMSEQVVYQYVLHAGSRSRQWNLDNLLDLANMEKANLAAIADGDEERMQIREALAFIKLLVASEDNSSATLLSQFLRHQLLGVVRGKGIVVYGTGSTGRQLMALLTQADFPNRVFCDSASNKWGTDCDGVNVVSPQDLIHSKLHDYTIVIGSCFIQEIVASLSKLGLHHRVYLPQLSDFHSFSHATTGGLDQ